MTHAETCHLLTTILHILWWPVFVVVIAAILFLLAALCHTPPGE